MRTEYPFGLGRDRRVLSRYQTREWCRHIASLKHNFTGRAGELNSNSKLTEHDVLMIRIPKEMPRRLARVFSEQLGVAIAYIYQLRKIVSGSYKRWPHLHPGRVKIFKEKKSL